jgi:hypothetical protein
MNGMKVRVLCIGAKVAVYRRRVFGYHVGVVRTLVVDARFVGIESTRVVDIRVFIGVFVADAVVALVAVHWYEATRVLSTTATRVLSATARRVLSETARRVLSATATRVLSATARRVLSTTARRVLSATARRVLSATQDAF